MQAWLQHFNAFIQLNSIYKILRYGASVGSTTTSGSGMMVPKNQLKKRGVSRISRQRIYSVKNSHSGNHSESKTSQFRHIFMTLNIPCKKRLVGEYGPARKPGHTEESQGGPVVRIATLSVLTSIIHTDGSGATSGYVAIGRHVNRTFPHKQCK